MLITRNKSVAIATIILLMLSMAASIMLIPANAHTPPRTVHTYAYIALSPNPVGVGQQVIVVFWVSPNPPTATGLGGDRWRDMTITITKPDDANETLGPFYSDPTGVAYTTYTPNQVGEYRFFLNYPGQVMSLTGPTGLPANLPDLLARGGDQWVNDTFLGSTATEYLTVQEEQIPKIPDTPLPTEYWTRPIEGQNSAWATIASNWLGGSHIGGYANLWQKYGTAPNSPHIMWTRPIETGGIVGGTGDIPGIGPDVGFYSGGSYEGRFTNAMIMFGRLYYAEPLGHSNTGGGYTCLDLRTGKVMWHRDDIAYTTGNTSTGAPNTILVPAFGQLFDYESQNQHGVVGGILWALSTEAGVRIWSAYDAFTGKWLFNETNAPIFTGRTGDQEQSVLYYTPKGEYIRYVLNYNRTARSGWLALWNNTRQNVGLELVDPGGGTGTNAFQWRPNGKSVNMSNAYSWNVTITADLSGLSAPIIVGAIPGDIILGTSSTFNAFIAYGAGTPDPYTIWAISDKPESRGQLLWIKNYTAPTGDVTRSFSLAPIDTVNRVFFMRDMETMSWLGYNLDNGNLLWGPLTGNKRAYSYFGSGLGAGPIGWPAYGNLYTQGYGGEIVCYDGKTGKILWLYNNTYSGIETAWGYYPIFIGAISDGKVYAFNNEHSPNYPLYKGEKVYCINATTGEEIWTLLGWAGQSGGPGTSTMIQAEGYLAYYNYYDNQIYVIGKGPSKLNVNAPSVGVTTATPITISGTITDISAGSQQDAVLSNFPNGLPCVSDASMNGWMEYVYMQKPCPANVTGVPITIDVIDSNGNYRNIGTIISDGSGTFAFTWTPDIPGDFTVITTFAGSESYYPSSAEAHFHAATVAPTASPPPEISLEPTQMYVLGMGIAIIVVIIVIGALILLALRKRP
ncbi:MAG: PQQ-like beta-propeller repeat protein [Candidatus Bathyarchaeota archaeon]|nr:PQQ-like beta-propeller repeat protein [Candidatus Bathyarchaeota archaeon]